MKLNISLIVHKGGKGSGHFGHAGRIGKVGGSTSNKFQAYKPTGPFSHLSGKGRRALREEYRAKWYRGLLTQREIVESGLFTDANMIKTLNFTQEEINEARKSIIDVEVPSAESFIVPNPKYEFIPNVGIVHPKDAIIVKKEDFESGGKFENLIEPTYRREKDWIVHHLVSNQITEQDLYDLDKICITSEGSDVWNEHVNVLVEDAAGYYIKSSAKTDRPTIVIDNSNIENEKTLLHEIGHHVRRNAMFFGEYDKISVHSDGLYAINELYYALKLEFPPYKLSYGQKVLALAKYGLRTYSMSNDSEFFADIFQLVKSSYGTVKNIGSEPNKIRSALRELNKKLNESISEKLYDKLYEMHSDNMYEFSLPEDISYNIQTLLFDSKYIIGRTGMQ